MVYTTKSISGSGENVRQLGLAKLLHSYGGVIIPDNTIMLRNMENIHKEKLSRNDMYVGELINRNSSSVSHRFFPSHKLMGCKKSKSMKELIENLEVMISTNHNDVVKFDGIIDRHINKLCME